MIVLMAFLFGLGYIVWALLQDQRETAQSIRCSQNLKSLSLALLQYSEDWDGRLPPADHWIDCIDNARYLPVANRASLFHCPGATTPYGYALNSSVGGISLDTADFDHTHTVLLFETDSRVRNANGSKILLARKRHGELNCSFCDGYVHWANPVRPE